MLSATATGSAEVLLLAMPYMVKQLTFNINPQLHVHMSCCYQEIPRPLGLQPLI